MAAQRCELPPAKLDPEPEKTILFVQMPGDLLLDMEAPLVFSRLPGADKVRLRNSRMRFPSQQITGDSYRAAFAEGCVEAAAGATFGGDPDIVLLACTSFSFLVGPDKVAEKLSQGCPGALVTDLASAVRVAASAMGAKRVALLTPYVEELHAKNIEWLEEGGCEVVVSSNLSLSTDREISAVNTAFLEECGKKMVAGGGSVDLFIMGCSAIRSMSPGTIPGWEAALGVPVISSQQSLLWHAMCLAGLETETLSADFGTLFAKKPSL